jgi:hypothetical protein
MQPHRMGSELTRDMAVTGQTRGYGSVKLFLLSQGGVYYRVVMDSADFVTEYADLR